MAGIYVHIPFCKQACHYCDFYFTTRPATQNELVECLLKELALQKDYLDGEIINTIYFGGGTPSLLSKGSIRKILDEINHHFCFSPHCEVTLEANPDDLTKGKTQELKDSGVNRLSIGVQSFFDEDLRWMNRAHDSREALQSIKLAQDIGFTNLSIDLIYGLPELSIYRWEETLNQTFQLNLQHLSCYCLTIEESTALYHFIKEGKIRNPDENESALQFELLIDKTEKAGWRQYEISNFCVEDYYSKHNTSYWRGEKYLGIGPSAHSFDGKTRQWNVSNIQQYLKTLSKGVIPFEKEILSEVQRLNEYIMTSLRTMWGCNLNKIQNDFGESFANTLKEKIRPFVQKNLLTLSGPLILLSRQGKLLADHITLDLMFPLMPKELEKEMR